MGVQDIESVKIAPIAKQGVRILSIHSTFAKSNTIY
jgi:hypothetical protein